MNKELTNILEKYFWLTLKQWLIRYNIEKGKEWISDRITIEYNDRNSYAPSEDWYKWKLLCASATDTFKNTESFLSWVILILADKMLWFSQDINWIQKDYNLVRKK